MVIRRGELAIIMEKLENKVGYYTSAEMTSIHGAVNYMRIDKKKLQYYFDDILEYCKQEEIEGESLLRPAVEDIITDIIKVQNGSYEKKS